MNQNLICEFIDIILFAVESGKLERSEARDYLLKAVLIASDEGKNIDIYMESVIRDVALS